MILLCIYKQIFVCNIVVYNSSQVHSVAMLELTCLQLLAEFDRLSISSYYETIEISALGHYQPASIGNYLNSIKFSNPTINV